MNGPYRSPPMIPPADRADILRRLDEMGNHDAAASMVAYQVRHFAMPLDVALLLFAENLLERHTQTRGDLCKMLERFAHPPVVVAGTTEGGR